MNMDQPKLFDVYRFDPEDDKHHLAGRFMIHGGKIHVLSDYHDLLGGLEGPLAKVQKKLDALKKSSYFKVVDRDELAQGHHSELLPETEVPLGANGGQPLPVRPPAVFSYEHPVIGRPTTLESRDGELYFEGQQLSREEAHRILENIRSGVAVIRYKHKDAISKMEKSLAKIEPGLASALDALRQASASGAIHPDHVRNLTREIFVDSMVEGVGNKKAYADHLSRPQQGVYVQLDSNDMGSLNKLYSFQHGDHAIKATGQAIKEARDESVGKSLGKIFRVGGDEFVAHMPTHEHAAQFLRTLRGKLEAIPPVAGTHNLSVSAGIGRTPQEADQAQIHAKTAKKSMNYPLGQAQTHVHSLIPGHEGPVPVHEDLPLKAPPAQVRETPSSGPSGSGVVEHVG